MQRLLCFSVRVSCLFFASAQAQKKTLERWVVANGVISENRVPVWIAKELGLFEK